MQLSCINVDSVGDLHYRRVMPVGFLKRAAIFVLVCFVTAVFSFTAYHHASDAGDPCHDEAHCELCAASHSLVAWSFAAAVTIVSVVAFKGAIHNFVDLKSFASAKRFDCYKTLAPPHHAA